MSPIPSTAPSATASNATVTTSAVATDQNMFLQLLVAQLQNQDPLSPMDSTAFVTQLAQFQQLESTVNMGQDISGIRSDADQLLASYNAAKTAATGASTGSATPDANATGTSGATQTTQP